MLIQPFVENALLHGLLHKKGKKKLSISFEFDQRLKCTIIDNGIGRIASNDIKNRQGQQHESFALNAIKNRLKILSTELKMDFNFTTTDLYKNGETAGTQIEISVPFMNYF